MSSYKIFFDWHLNERLGGPPGYLANLKNGLSDISDNSIIDFVYDESDYINNKAEYSPSFVGKIIKNLDSSKIGKKILCHNFSNRYKSMVSFIDYLESIDNMFLTDEQITRVNFPATRYVHAHTTIDAVKLINTIRKYGHTTKVILTSHCPEAPANEWAEKFRVDGLNEKLVSRLRNAYQVVDEFAFRYADRLVFPSKEAMEPYQLEIEGFDEIVNAKPIDFIYTGCNKLEPKKSKKVMLEELNIPSDSIIIGFMGRHNKIKGYDILIDIAKSILAENDNVYFLIGGSPGELIPLKHDRWIEIGWTNEPNNYINCFDLFVLPNRQTYFDLISLEVLSLNIPVLASNTGGNKSIGQLCESYHLFDNVNDAISIARGIIKDKEYEYDSYSCYDKYFSLSVFAKSYSCYVNDLIKKSIYDVRSFKSREDYPELISIIVPIYNVENYLLDCLVSLSHQTYKNIEIILVDDGSSDNSSIIAKNYSSLDSRFIYKYKNNGGLSSARNFGLNFSSGKYIVFVDSDDICSSYYIEKLSKPLLLGSCDLSICAINFQYGDANNTSSHSAIHNNNDMVDFTLSCDSSTSSLVDFFPSAWNKMYKKSLLSDLKYIDGIFYEDHDFFWRYLERCESLTYIQDKLYTQRQGREGQITSISSKKIFDIFTVLDLLKDNWFFFENKRLFAKLSIRLCWERMFVISNELYDEFLEKSNELFEEIGFSQQDLISLKDSFIPEKLVTILVGDKEIVVSLSHYNKNFLDKIKFQSLKNISISNVGISPHEKRIIFSSGLNISDKNAELVLDSYCLDDPSYIFQEINSN